MEYLLIIDSVIKQKMDKFDGNCPFNVPFPPKTNTPLSLSTAFQTDIMSTFQNAFWKNETVNISPYYIKLIHNSYYYSFLYQS